MFGNPIASIGEVAYGFRSLGAEVAAGTRHGAFFVGLGKGLKSLGGNTTSGLLGVWSAACVLGSRHGGVTLAMWHHVAGFFVRILSGTSGLMATLTLDAHYIKDRCV